MGMEDAALLGVFAIIVLFGYVIMARLDRFFGKVRQGDGARRQADRFRIATSCLQAIPAISNALQEFERLYPDVQCRVSVGQEREVIEALERGEADVAIIAADSDAARQTEPQWSCITLNPRPFFTEAGRVEVEALGEPPRGQKALWRGNDTQALAVNFLRQLCGQMP